MQTVRERRRAIHSKKGSLELSIRSIVIVVLAMTLLGLGLGFIKSMFGNISQLSESTFDKISEQVQTDLVTGNEKLVFSQTRITVERKDSLLLGWGVKNDQSASLDYWVEFTPISCPKDSNGIEQCPEVEAFNQEWFTFKYLRKAPASRGLLYSLDAADSHVRRVDLTIPNGALPGLYLIELALYERGTGSIDDDDLYATTEIFLTVN